MNARDIAHAIRTTLRIAGIKASVRTLTGRPGGVSVGIPAGGRHFTTAEQEAIRSIAVALGLTFPRGVPIVPTRGDMGGIDIYHLPREVRVQRAPMSFKREFTRHCVVRLLFDPDLPVEQWVVRVAEFRRSLSDRERARLAGNARAMANNLVDTPEEHHR